MIQSRSQQREGGFILIVVLGAVLTLSALLFGFNQRTRTSLNAADGFYRTEQVWNSAWAGLQIAIAAVCDANDLSADNRFASLLTGENAFTVGDATCSVTIQEENGLLNVNYLTGQDGEPDRRRVERFLRLIDLLNRRDKDLERIGYGIVPSIIDWVDSDDDVTHLPFIKNENTGAESGYYEAQAPPCSCRNRPVDNLDELISVKGITAENLDRLRPFLTCLGDGRININAAPKLVIESLSEQIDGALAQMIVNRREMKPFGAATELRDIPGMTDNIYRAIKDTVTTRPADRYYRVTARGNVEDRKGTIEAVLRRNTRAGNVDTILYREL